MIEILLIEDDPVLGRGLVVAFELEGFKVHWARSLKIAFENEKALKLNLIILDLNLPDGNGFQFLKSLREKNSRLPVIVLTAKTDENSVVEGFKLGANDYLRKPFSDKELFARINSLLRTPTVREHQIRFGDLLLLLDSRQAMYGDKSIDINRREFDILHILVEKAEQVVTRDYLLERLDTGGDMFDRTIDSHISHLRSRLKKSGLQSLNISSVYGVGYRLVKK